jgi:hypothetical protein
LLDRWRAHTDEQRREAEVTVAYEALQEYFGQHFTAFDTQTEAPEYLRAAKASMRKGFRTVIYGHTHLAKRFSPKGVEGLYLNTGAWADLMAVPKAILLDHEAQARVELRTFLDQLAKNDLNSLRKTLATFARLEMDGQAAVDRDVLVYEGNGKHKPLPEGRFEPLAESMTSGGT